MRRCSRGHAEHLHPGTDALPGTTCADCDPRLSPDATLPPEVAATVAEYEARLREAYAMAEEDGSKLTDLRADLAEARARADHAETVLRASGMVTTARDVAELLRRAEAAEAELIAYRASLRAQGWHLPADCPTKRHLRCVHDTPEEQDAPTCPWRREDCPLCDDGLDSRPLPPEVQAACEAAAREAEIAIRGAWMLVLDQLGAPSLAEAKTEAGRVDALIALRVAAEREACAALAEAAELRTPPRWSGVFAATASMRGTLATLAGAIRARGEPREDRTR